MATTNQPLPEGKFEEDHPSILNRRICMDMSLPWRVVSQFRLNDRINHQDIQEVFFLNFNYTAVPYCTNKFPTRVPVKISFLSFQPNQSFLVTSISGMRRVDSHSLPVVLEILDSLQYLKKLYPKALR